MTAHIEQSRVLCLTSCLAPWTHFVGVVVRPYRDKLQQLSRFTTQTVFLYGFLFHGSKPVHINTRTQGSPLERQWF